jgi:hypothetical protein
MNQLRDNMHAFQALHNTQGRCMDNAVFLKDSLTASGRHARVQAVIATWTDASRVNVVVHMVVVDAVQGIIDPSFEVARQPNVQYATTINGSPLGRGHLSAGGISRRDAIATFLEFIEHAKCINAGMFLLSDKEYYNAQADYLGAGKGVHPQDK